jgi:hypothetical protein
LFGPDRHHEIGKLLVPARTLVDRCSIVWMMGNDVNGDFRGAKILYVSLVRVVILYKGDGLFDCLGSRSQELIEL